MRWHLPLLFAATTCFLLSAAGSILALERDSAWLALAAACGMLLATVLFLLSVWLPRRRVDWERIRAEQRLWESGPLGRRWLRIRRRLSNLWKI